MKKRLLLLPLLAGLVMGGCDFSSIFNKKDDPGTQDTPIDENTPAVKSVAISGNQAKLSVGLTMQLSASVEVVNGASNSVTWSTSAESVATVSASGLVTGIAEGEVTITATSSFDATKSASVTIQVVEEGFDPSWIEEGFTYSKAFPVAKIKEFLGEGSYEIVELENLVGGCYYQKVVEEGYADSFVLVVDGVRDEEYAYALMDEGFERVFYSYNYSCIEAVDPTGKYTVDMYSAFDEETYEYVAPTIFEFYKSEDVWDSSEITTDIAWDEAKIVNEDAEEIAAAQEYLAKVPFVALGEDYEIEMVIDDSAKEEIISLLEMFGMDPASMTEEELNEWLELLGYEGPEVYFSIYDYSLCEPFEGYDAVLEGAGYVAQEDEEGYTYYELADGLNAYVLSYGFADSGNTIMVEQAPATLLEFPLEAVNSFIETEIGSENRAIAYEETEGATFMAQISNGTIVVAVDYVNLEEAAAYAAKYQEAGFEVNYTPSSLYDYPSWECTKGKLDIYFAIQQVTDESGEYIDEGPLYIYFMGDDTKHEEQGIYLPEAMTVKLFEQELVLPLEIVKLENRVFTVVSSNPEVATVEGLNVTLVAGGETTITVSVQDTSFVASMVLTVDEKTYDDEALEELAAWLEECGVQDYTLPLPEGTHIANEEDFYYDEYYECYTIMLNTSITDMEYYAQLEAVGYTIGEDTYGYYAYLGDVVISAWEYEPGVLEIDVYYEPASVGGEGASFDFSVLDDVSGEANGFEFVTDKASGQSAPAYNENKAELRLYANNTITFTSEEPMTSIFFDANTCGESKATATFTSASTGTVTAVDGGFLWEGSATEVTLTVSSSGQIHINAIEINGGGEGGGGQQTADSEEAFIQELVCLIFDQDSAELDVDYGYDDGYYTVFYGEDLTDSIDELYSVLSTIYDCEAYDEDGYYGFYIDSLDGTCYADVYSYEYGGYVYIEIDIWGYED